MSKSSISPIETQREEELKLSSERSFGIVMAAFFAIVGGFPLLYWNAPRWWSLAIAAGFAVLAFAKPSILAPANRLWMRFGLLLHTIVNPVIMALVFFVTVVPIGVAMRLMGKDLLRLRLDRETPSYWIERRPPGPAPDSMKNQF